jgi:hypothetical protein
MAGVQKKRQGTKSREVGHRQGNERFVDLMWERRDVSVSTPECGRIMRKIPSLGQTLAACGS